jgi:hypothetical protein
MQFLAEAVLLAMLGGVSGVLGRATFDAITSVDRILRDLPA